MKLTKHDENYAKKYNYSFDSYQLSDDNRPHLCRYPYLLKFTYPQRVENVWTVRPLQHVHGELPHVAQVEGR